MTVARFSVVTAAVTAASRNPRSSTSTTAHSSALSAPPSSSTTPPQSSIMGDFFGDYSIETASCHPSALPPSYEDNSEYSAAYGLLSPRNTRTSYPIELANMSNLSRAFSLQMLDSSSSDRTSALESQSSYALSSDRAEPPPSPSADRSSFILPRTPPPCWRRRLQRQRDTRLQNDPSHLSSIAQLVERMVDQGEQCETIVRKRPTPLALTPSVTPSVHDDEEDNEDTSEASDLSSPRSVSGSSSNGRMSANFSTGSGSPQNGRFAEYQASSVSKNGRVQKSRSRRRR